MTMNILTVQRLDIAQGNGTSVSYFCTCHCGWQSAITENSSTATLWGEKHLQQCPERHKERADT